VLFASLAIDPDGLPERPTRSVRVMLIAVDGRAEGLVAVADPVKERRDRTSRGAL
jgi:hypothetical protein